MINAVFTPGPEQIEKAKAIVAAFAAKPGAGTVGIDGKMYDRPHLARAQALLASAGGSFQRRVKAYFRLRLTNSDNRRAGSSVS